MLYDFREPDDYFYPTQKLEDTVRGIHSSFVPGSSIKLRSKSDDLIGEDDVLMRTVFDALADRSGGGLHVGGLNTLFSVTYGYTRIKSGAKENGRVVIDLVVRRFETPLLAVKVAEGEQLLNDATLFKVIEQNIVSGLPVFLVRSEGDIQACMDAVLEAHMAEKEKGPGFPLSPSSQPPLGDLVGYAGL